MPVVRRCSHCGKRYIASTYVMVQHVERCTMTDRADLNPCAGEMDVKTEVQAEATVGVVKKE